MPKSKVKGQTVQTGERPQTNGRTHTRMPPNVLSQHHGHFVFSFKYYNPDGRPRAQIQTPK